MLAFSAFSTRKKSVNLKMTDCIPLRVYLVIVKQDIGSVFSIPSTIQSYGKAALTMLESKFIPLNNKKHCTTR